MRLRNENERIKRDHTEYENEIQRALLEGVSSLNTEALKVLRNSPFNYYKPCQPCNNPSQSSSDTYVKSCREKKVTQTSLKFMFIFELIKDFK